MIPGSGLRRLLGPSALLVLALLPGPAGAVEASYHLGGWVTRVLTNTPAAQAALQGLGVAKNIHVDIDWTVDLDVAAQSGDPNSLTRTYLLAITSLTIKIGNWDATGANPSAFNTVNVNKIIVEDGAPGHDDFMDMFRSGTDTNGVLTGNDPNGSQLIFNFFAPGGGGSTSNSLGSQTPSDYPDSTGTVFGMGGEVDFGIPGVAPTGDITQKCRAAQIASAATLCKATFACLATNAKAPLKDPGNLKLDTCRAKADQKFVTAYDKAETAAASKGLACGTTEPGQILVEHLDDGVDDVVAFAGTIDPPLPALLASWYTAAGGMCSTAAKAVSKNVTRPDPARLTQARANARKKLGDAATKAIATAEKHGVVFDPEPDVAALIAELDTLIDDVVAELNGLP
jgi:hypothetical protein